MAAAGQQGRFLTGGTMGHVVRMTLTGTASITFVFLVDAANLIWLSFLGEPLLLAAIGYAFAIQFFSVSVGVGMMIAATAVISRRIGMGQRSVARDEATAAMALTVLFQTGVAALVVLFRHDLLALAGAKDEALALASRYLLLTVPSLTVMAVGLIGSATLRADGDGRRAMFITLTSGASSMVFDPLLIWGLGWGLDGAAAVLVLSRFIMAAMALRFVIGVHNMLGPLRWASVVGTAGPFFRIALPALLTQLANPFANYLLTSVIAGFGDAVVAGWAVVNRLTVLAFGGLFSLSGAISGIFGQNYGAGQYDRLRSTYRDAVVFAVVYTLGAWAVLLLASGSVARAFGLGGEAAQLFHAFTHVGAAGFLLMAGQFVSNAAFNTLGRPGLASALNWLRDGALMFPLALWMSGAFGPVGVIYGQVVAGGVVGVLAGLWGWRHVRGIDPDHAPKLDLKARRAYRDPNRYRRR
jgi:putative MATE family efflux protein